MKFYIRFIIAWILILILYVMVVNLVMHSKYRIADRKLQHMGELLSRPIVSRCTPLGTENGGCCLTPEGIVSCSSVVDE
jgi:hypothetical protein